MKITKLTAIVACLAGFLPVGASAGPIALDTWYTFGFNGTGTSLVSGAGYVQGTNPPVGNLLATADDPAWTITLINSATLTFLDLFLSSDRFEIFNNLVSIGQTSAPVSGGSCDSDISCALADAGYSRGVFNLGPGSYSFTGTQVAGTGGAGVFMVASAQPPASVPTPSSLALFGAALAAAGMLRRRRARIQVV